MQPAEPALAVSQGYSLLHLYSLCVCCNAHVGVRGQLAGAGSLFPLCAFWRLNVCHRTWQPVPLPAKPFGFLLKLFFKNFLFFISTAVEGEGLQGE